MVSSGDMHVFLYTSHYASAEYVSYCPGQRSNVMRDEPLTKHVHGSKWTVTTIVCNYLAHRRLTRPSLSPVATDVTVFDTASTVNAVAGASRETFAGLLPRARWMTPRMWRLTLLRAAISGQFRCHRHCSRDHFQQDHLNR